jgi:ketopantoate hydroxymethyltransferase
MEQKVTVPEIVKTKAKAGGRPIVALTAYDFPFARIADEPGVYLIPPGD